MKGKRKSAARVNRAKRQKETTVLRKGQYNQIKGKSFSVSFYNLIWFLLRYKNEMGSDT